MPATPLLGNVMCFPSWTPASLPRFCSTSGTRKNSLPRTAFAACPNITISIHSLSEEDRVRYEPGESTVRIKGGNSNWRGPLWFPTTYLLIRSLLKFSRALGPDFAVRTPGSDGQPITPLAMAAEIADRMIGLFRKDEHERRPCFGPYRKFQEDPHWRDCLLFNEYYNADTGQGLGASHQTGWTGLVANLIDEWRR